MVDFSLCGDCQLEFHDHKDRRFHAQTMSCPACGPRLQWTDDAGRVLADGDQALQEAVAHLREGGLLAMKGVGGFQLVASALSEGAVERLREIKHRPSKPLAVLVPDLEEARRLAHVSPQERMLLSSPAAPIVVLFSCGGLPSNVAPGLDSVGLFLPYSPLHHLLVADFGGPLVVTSGNITDEPMPCGNEEALRRLPGCRRFLSHNRRIARSLDDSVAQVVAEHTQLLRRARGYSADSVEAPVEGGTLALGGHLKNTVALTSEGRIWVSPHIGDLDSDLTRERARWEAETLALRAGQKVERIVCDRHPDYGSTHLAEGYDLAREQIQHHEAHAWACAAEHGLRPPWLAVTWDGAGLGDDETLWGGEFWRARDDGKLHRIASLRPFRIPRGAALEPRRSALGILHELETGASEWNGLAGRFLETERLTLKALLSAGEGPMTTSIGRLFDAVGCLLHGRAVCEYEGQAAMELEVLARNGHPRHDLRFEVHFQEAPWRIDWEPMLHQMACRLQEGASTADLAAGFHQALSDVIVRVAHEAGEQIVLLCGGVFQNRLLLQATAEALFGEGFTAIWPRAFPPNDGGLSLGQAMAAARRNHVFGNSR